MIIRILFSKGEQLEVTNKQKKYILRILKYITYL